MIPVIQICPLSGLLSQGGVDEVVVLEGQTEQAAGSGHTEREIPAKALCAESAKAGKTEETERSGGFGCIGREKAAVTAEANLAEIGASV